MTDQLLARLQLYEYLGNINAVIQGCIDNYGALQHIKCEVLERIKFYLGSFPHLVSPATIEAIHSLPGQDLYFAKLDELLNGYRPFAPEPQVGRIAFPLITTSALIRDIVITHGPPANASAQRLKALDLVGSVLFKTLSSRLKTYCFWQPERFSYLVLDLHEQDDPAVEGMSLCLALAIALYSKIAGLPVPAHITAIAGLKRDGSLGSVDAISQKLEVIQQERFFITRALVAKDQNIPKDIRGIELIRASNLDEALSIVFPDKVRLGEVRVSLSLDDEIRSLNWQFDNYLLDTCIDNATQLIKFLEGPGAAIPNNRKIPALFTCYWKKASCYCHKGQSQQTAQFIKKAIALYRRHPGLIRPDDYFEAQVSYCVLLKDLFLYEEALSLHKVISREIEATKCLAHTKGANLSTLSQLYVAMREFPKAEKLQKEAIALIREDERYRNYGYLAQVYARSLQFPKAARALCMAYRLLKKAPNEIQKKKRAFLDWYKAEYLYNMGIHRPGRRKQIFERLYHISSLYPDIDFWIPALIHKFSALALLQENRAEKGLNQLRDVINFFDTQFAPVLKVLGASVKAHRALYFLQQGDMPSAFTDMAEILEDLSVQKDIKRFFNKELSSVSRIIGKRGGTTNNLEQAIRTLEAIVLKIPY